MRLDRQFCMFTDEHMSEMEKPQRAVGWWRALFQRVRTDSDKKKNLLETVFHSFSQSGCRCSNRCTQSTVSDKK